MPIHNNSDSSRPKEILKVIREHNHVKPTFNYILVIGASIDAVKRTETKAIWKITEVARKAYEGLSIYQSINIKSIIDKSVGTGSGLLLQGPAPLCKDEANRRVCSCPQSTTSESLIIKKIKKCCSQSLPC